MTRSVGEASFDENSDTVSRGTARTVSAHGLSDEDDDDDSVGGGVWVDSSRGDESETGKPRSHVFTAYDLQGTGHQRAASEGEKSESVHTGWKSGAIDKEDRSPREQRTVRKKRSGRWAKITVSYALLILQHHHWLTQSRVPGFRKVRRRLCVFPNPVAASMWKTKRKKKSFVIFRITCESFADLVRLAFWKGCIGDWQGRISLSVLS
jgi:hypothetical protein